MSENDEFIREFLDECEENLDQLDKDLVALEQDPGDSQRLESIFRTIHTIKGTSGFFSFAKLGALAHDGESLLGRLRDGELVLNQQIASALLELMDAIRAMLGCIAENGTEGTAEHGQLSAKLIRLALSSNAAATPDQPVAAVDGETLAEPSTEALEDEQASAAVPDASILAGATTPPADVAPVNSSAESTASSDAASPLDTAPAQDAEPLPSGDSSASVAPPAPVVPPSPGESSSSDADRKPPKLTSDAAKAGASEGSIRVDVRLLDELMDLAGELVLARNQLNQFSDSAADTPLLKTIQRLGQITSELQEGVMQTRMQPLSTIWRKFPRVIRDLALACDKEIELVQEGAETELDRSLLEAIKDPLTHLIRNAVDHGIESPEYRASQGKARKGRLLLRAYHEGGQVNIDIEDDGSGIDVQRVKQRALERGVIDTQQAQSMSDQELVQLIFRAGFSTAEKVTDVSGRGVGMDVVKTNIEKIRGSIAVQNRPGEGATVRITIPLTLAIIPALVIKACGHRFAIPQVSLIELLSYGVAESGQQVEWVNDAPVYRLRGNLLPLVYLDQLLELEREPTQRWPNKRLPDTSEASGRQSNAIFEPSGSEPNALASGIRRENVNQDHPWLAPSAHSVESIGGEPSGIAAPDGSRRSAKTATHLGTSPQGAAGNIVVLQAEGCRFGLVVNKVINTEEIVVKALSRKLKPLAVYAGATIMGDGAVALILDVVGLARKAGLAVAKKAATPAEEPVAPAATLPYLLCENDDGRRVAMRLAEVHRLESIASNQVEQAASTEAIQYGGQIVPLVRLSRLLGWTEVTASQDEPLSVVIHRQSGRDAGLVVPRIVDIVDGPQRFERDAREGSGASIVGSSLIEGRVTDIIDLSSAMQGVQSRRYEPVGDPT